MLVRELNKSHLNRPIQLMTVEGASHYQGMMGYLTTGFNEGSFGFQPLNLPSFNKYQWISLSGDDEIEFIE
jgi:hypothetical protein